MKNSERILNIIKTIYESKQEASPVIPTKNYKYGLMKVVNTSLDLTKKIVIYGDFDPDGFFSAIMLYSYLKKIRTLVGGDEKSISLKFSKIQNGFGLTEKEFNSFNENFDLVILTDNGSDLNFISGEKASKLLVLDHHPTKNFSKHIINPNMRSDGMEYSTSAGRVVYGFIKNLEKVFLQIRGLRVLYEEKIQSSGVLGIYKELAAFSLISDMAVLDKTNRDFIKESFRTIKDDIFKVPLYRLINEAGGINSRSVSFNLISQINGWRRMGKDLGEITGWVAPNSYDEFKKISLMVEKNNNQKKREVNKYTSIGHKKMIKKGGFYYFFDPDMKVGLTGLIANKLSAAHNNVPVIVATLNNDTISMSGRGNNVRDDIFSVLFEDKKGRFGGHRDACGGVINQSEFKGREKIEEYFKEIMDQLDGKIGTIERDDREIVACDPVDVEELIQLQNLYSLTCGGVGGMVDIRIPVNNYTISGSHTFSSGWVKVFISSKDKADKRISFLIDTREHSLEDIEKGNIIIFSLSPAEEFVVDKVLEMPVLKNYQIFDPDEYIRNKNKNTSIKAKEENINERNANDNEKAKNIDTNIDNRPRIEFIEEYLPKEIRNNPLKLFVFEDNLEKWGIENKFLRDQGNAFGIPTKISPNNDKNAFFNDSKEQYEFVSKSLKSLFEKFDNSDFTTIALPEKIGDSSNLKKYSPNIYNLIVREIATHFNINNDNYKEIAVSSSKNIKEAPAVSNNVEQNANI